MRTWISLRALLDSLESDTGFDRLNPISQRMLEWIAVRLQNSAPLHIQEIVMKSGVASPATVHKAIAILERQGLISVSRDEIDSRRRIVHITPRAERLLAGLSKGVDAWARALAKAPVARGAKSTK